MDSSSLADIAKVVGVTSAGVFAGMSSLLLVSHATFQSRDTLSLRVSVPGCNCQTKTFFARVDEGYGEPSDSGKVLLA